MKAKNVFQACFGLYSEIFDSFVVVKGDAERADDTYAGEKRRR